MIANVISIRQTKNTNNCVGLGSIEPSNTIFITKKKLKIKSIMEKVYHVDELTAFVLI
jgi:hypothetical protein